MIILYSSSVSGHYPYTRIQPTATIATESVNEIGDAVWPAYRWKWCDVCKWEKVQKCTG